MHLKREEQHLRLRNEGSAAHIALMVSLICGLVLIDWVLGVDRPRIIDYILHPISTCSTHRTGRIEL